MFNSTAWRPEGAEFQPISSEYSASKSLQEDEGEQRDAPPMHAELSMDSLMKNPRQERASDTDQFVNIAKEDCVEEEEVVNKLKA